VWLVAQNIPQMNKLGQCDPSPGCLVQQYAA
jgi:hypothetical protein